MPAFGELLREGYGIAPAGSARVSFQSYLRIIGTGIALVYLLGVASDAAASLTSERENETWISLITTPLTGTEIIRAKMLGAIWEIRHTAIVLAALWLLGVLVGSVHPLGLLAALIELAAFTWFTAALGTWISLRARHTMQAMGRVMASLLLISGGSLLVTLPILAVRPLALTACGPLLLALTLASHGDLQGKPAAGSFGLVPDSVLGAVWVGRGPEMALTCLAQRARRGARCLGPDPVRLPRVRCLSRPPEPHRARSGLGLLRRAVATTGGLRRSGRSQRVRPSLSLGTMTAPEAPRPAAVRREPGMTGVDDPACGFAIAVGVAHKGMRPRARVR